MTCQINPGIVVHCVTEASKGLSDPSPLTSPAAIAALITVVGAVLAAVVAYLGHRVSKNNAEIAGQVARDNAEAASKVALDNAALSARLAVNTKLCDLRQAWINSLRSDMAEFQAMAVTPDYKFANNPKFYAVMGRIELSVSKNDPNYGELSETLYSYINGKRSDNIENYDKRFTNVCQDILKSEWDVLKKELGSVNTVALTQQVPITT